MADYIIPLGLDSKGVVDGVNSTLDALNQMDSKAKQAGKTFEDVFSKGAKASNEMDNALKPTSESFEDLINVARAAKGEIGGALDVKKEAGQFSQIINKVRDKLREVTDKQKIGIEVDKKTLNEISKAADFVKKNYKEMTDAFSRASEDLDENIKLTKENIQSISTDLKNMEDALKRMAPGTAKLELTKEFEAAKRALEEEQGALTGYEQQLKEVSGAQSTMAKTLQDVDKAMKLNSGESKTLRQQYLEVRRELQKMQHAGEANTERFRELTKEAANLKISLDTTEKTISGVSNSNIKLRATMQGAQGLIGIFTAYQGVMALVGSENEEVEKILLKVNGAMAILYATQTLLNVVQKDSALSIALLNRFRKTQVAETQAATAATTANATATKGATLATRGLGVALKAIGIGLIVSAIAYLVSNWDDLYNRFKKFLPEGEKMRQMFDDIKEVAMGVGTAIIEFIAMPIKALALLIQGDLKGFKDAIKDGFDFAGNYQEGAQKQAERNEENHLIRIEKARIEADARDLERRKNRGEDVEKLEIALQKRRIDIAKREGKNTEELNEELEDMEDRHYKTMSDKQKKAYEERLRIEKQQADQIKKLGQEIESMQIDAIENRTQREIQKIRHQYRLRIQAIQEEEALTAEARRKQAKLIELIIDEREDAISEIIKKSLQERYQLELEVRDKLASLAEDSVETQLEILEVSKLRELEAINEKYKDEEELRVKLIEALEENVARERKKIQDDATKEQLKEEEERQLLIIELMQSGAEKSEETERQKQIAILETKLEFSKKYLDALIASGADENSLEVLQARNTIKNIRQALEDEISSGGGFDFFEFLGMRNLSDDERQGITGGVQTMLDSFSSITDGIIANYDRQIAKRQENLRSIQKEIDTLESELEREKSLQEQGYAANVTMVQKALDQKKKQQQEEIKREEEIQKKREKVQKAQMAADTAVQSVNLITASTSIFESFAKIPFGIGIPLAIATIALMLGAFASAKMKANKAISSKYEKGGWIKGEPHSRGGVKYYGDGGVKELEGNEFVVNKKQAKKYAGLLEAINDDKLSSVSAYDEALKKLLDEVGISFLGSGAISKAIKESSEAKALRQNIVIKPSGYGERELRQMNRNIDFLARKEREKTVSWSDDRYTYVREGNTTTRILKE